MDAQSQHENINPQNTQCMEACPDAFSDLFFNSFNKIPTDTLLQNYPNSLIKHHFLIIILS